jgi:hypothetical protein
MVREEEDKRKYVDDRRICVGVVIVAPTGISRVMMMFGASSLTSRGNWN